LICKKPDGRAELHGEKYMTPDRLYLWIVFNVFVLGMLAIDLGVFHRKAHAVTTREATIWCIVWVSLGLLFNAGIYIWLGPEKGLEFFTGYLIEYSLSVDNIFVFIIILSYFSVSPAHQHRVLFWGILGALIMRGVFIGAGALLLQLFHWVIYVFGAFLVFTGIKMIMNEDTSVHPEDNPVIKVLRRLMPISSDYEGQRFFVKRDGRWAATPLFVVLLVIESTDLIFAVDSVPAIFAVSQDPFIVYTSNVFAILGLRSLYFLLAGVMGLFVYLRYGLGVVLGFVGVKMILADVYKIPIGLSLAVVAGILTISIVASLMARPRVSLAERGYWSFLRKGTNQNRRGVLSAGSNKFWIWVAIIGGVLATVAFVQPGFPGTIR
jgi:tellurite resistance protein TerC